MNTAEIHTENDPVPREGEPPFARELERIREAYERRKVTVPLGRYSIGNLRQALALAEIDRIVFQHVVGRHAQFPSSTTVLDIGCGEGHWLRRFIREGAFPENVVGVDLLPDRIAKARQFCPPLVSLFCCDASQMPFPDGSFDLLLSMTVFSSILDSNLRRALAAEMLRVLRPGGAIIWYDFHVNNPRNPDVRRVTSDEIHELLRPCRIDLERVTLAPPIGQVVAEFEWVYSLLSRIRILSTHYLGWIQKP
jgi:ubiquinone/menaquinone biosynthesis C-methylase UbiE